MFIKPGLTSYAIMGRFKLHLNKVDVVMGENI